MVGIRSHLYFAGACALVLVLTPAVAMAGAPNDPLYPQQWGLSGSAASINAPEAWCASTGAGVLVADVDTGANLTHPDLAGRLVAGARFTDDTGMESQGGVDDDVFHGTMTTGIMVADYNNGTGIAGVAPAAKALIVKVLSRTVDSNGNVGGQGYSQDVAAGIDYAVGQGAQVINLSLGTDVVVSNVPGSDPTGPAISRAVQAGRVVVVAAGNGDPVTGTGLPVADYMGLGAIVVGALGPDGSTASYSNNLVGVDVYAPGGNDPNGTGSSSLNVLSTYLGGRYAANQGTSFATPHVSGVAALLIAHGMSPSAVRQQIINTRNSRTGGVDAAAALGTSGGCPGTPPTTNNPSTSASPGGSGNRGTTRPGTTGPAPSPAAIPSASPSPSPEVALVIPGTAATTSPATTVTPRAGPPRPPIYALLGLTFNAKDSLWLLAVAIVVGIAAGYSALFFIKAVGRE